MVEVILTDTVQSLSVKIRATRPRIVRVHQEARLSGLDRPGASGDAVQFLGRKSRRVNVRDGVAYSFKAHATELSNVALMLAWMEAGTVLTYSSPVFAAGGIGVFKVRIESMDVYEEGSPTGVAFDMVLVETDATPGLPPGVVPTLPPGTTILISSVDLVFTEDLVQAAGVDAPNPQTQFGLGDVVHPVESEADTVSVPGAFVAGDVLQPVEALNFISGTNGTGAPTMAAGSFINLASRDNVFTEDVLVTNT